MYHAPVPLDIDPSEAEPAEVADSGLGVDAGSRKLTEAHLHQGQAQARALFAPFLTATSLGSALLVAWALFPAPTPVLPAGGPAGVGGPTFITFRSPMQDRAAAGSRSAERRSTVRAIGEA